MQRPGRLALVNLPVPWHRGLPSSTAKEWGLHQVLSDEHEPRAWGWGPPGHLGRIQGGSKTHLFVEPLLVLFGSLWSLWFHQRTYMQTYLQRWGEAGWGSRYSVPTEMKRGPY